MWLLTLACKTTQQESVMQQNNVNIKLTAGFQLRAVVFTSIQHAVLQQPITQYIQAFTCSVSNKQNLALLSHFCD